MSWQPGPLPPATFWWGGVVSTAQPEGVLGFLLACFRGDHAVIIGGPLEGTRLEANEVKWWNNALCMPPDQQPYRGVRGRETEQPLLPNQFSERDTP